MTQLQFPARRGRRKHFKKSEHRGETGLVLRGFPKEIMYALLLSLSAARLQNSLCLLQPNY